MSMLIRTNTSALNSHRSLKGVESSRNKASNRLSTGYKINTAADDAAGLAISEKMKSQIRGMEQAQQNVTDAISLIQVMDGGMDGIQEMMIRQRELIIKSLNDTNEGSDRDKIQQEINQLTAEMGEIADRVSFNNIPLLSIPSGGVTGPSASLMSRTTSVSPFTAIPYGEAHVDYAGTAPTGVSSLGTITLSAGEVLVVQSPGYINTTITRPDGTTASAPINNLSGAGVYQFDINNTTGSDQTFQFCIFLSSWPDNSGLWIQTGANSEQGTFIDRYDCRPDSLNIKNLVIDPRAAAEQSLADLDAAFGKINEYRGRAGAQQNRLEYTEISLVASSTNLQESNSRIVDADMAKEMMELTKANVLQQASVSMLAQANQSPNNVLQLLQQ